MSEPEKHFCKEAVARAITRSGMRMEEVAVGAKRSVSTLYRWLSGETVPDVNDVANLANTLGTAPSEFFVERESIS